MILNTNNLIDLYKRMNEKQRRRLMDHIDNITSKEKSPRKEKKKSKKPKRGAVMSPLGTSYYDDH